MEGLLKTSIVKGLPSSNNMYEVKLHLFTSVINFYFSFITGGLIPPTVLENIAINFSNVHFTYPLRSDIPILKGIDLNVPSGSITAVVGASGSGKSTIGSLLLRLYDPDCGHITIGNYDVKKLDPTWLRRYIGTVNQVSAAKDKYAFHSMELFLNMKF